LTLEDSVGRLKPRTEKVLSADERAFFAEHGWLVLRGFVSGEHATKLSRAVDGLYPPSSYPGGCGSAVEGRDDVWELASASSVEPLLREQWGDARVAQAAAEALGCSAVQLLQDTLLVKPPHTGAAVPWHQDHRYTGYLEPARLVTARLALTKCTLASGCLHVLDGSHAWGLQGDVKALTARKIDDALALLPRPLAGRVSAATRVIELSPGDVSLHHCLTFHCSPRNQSAQARKTAVARFFDASCTLRHERLPLGAEAHFPTADGKRLSPAAFPVLYRSGSRHGDP